MGLLSALMLWWLVTVEVTRELLQMVTARLCLLAAEVLMVTLVQPGGAGGRKWSLGLLKQPCSMPGPPRAYPLTPRTAHKV